MRKTSTPSRCAAFTLIELMVVITIVALLLTLSFSSFSGQVSSQKLYSSTTQIADAFAYAAQLAAQDSRTVHVVFHQRADILDPDGPKRYRAYQLMAENHATGKLEPLGESVALENGVILLDHPDYSTLLQAPRATDEPCNISFKPDGGTTLPKDAAQHWCLTLALEADITRAPSALPPGSRTLVLNAHTGAVVVY